MNRDIPILMYHHVCPEPNASRHFPWAVTPVQFRRQMAFLRRSGYETVHLSFLVPRVAADSGKKVVITFDDGARNLLAHAVPVLQEYGMTATFFLPTRLLGGCNSWDRDYGYPGEELMGHDEVRALHGAGFEIGSHGASHVNLKAVSTEIALREMRESRHCLEALLGAPVRFLAYPFGEYPPEYADLCRQSGYAGACSISSPADHTLDDPFALRRILVHAKDSLWRFRMKLHPWYLRLAARRDRRNAEVPGEQ